MRWIVLGCVLILTGCSGGPGEGKDGTRPGPPPVDPSRHAWGNKPAPETEGRDGEGKRFGLADYKGKVILLDFWASWCGPCMMIVPHERALVTALKDRPFVVLGVNADNKLADMHGAEKDHQINWRSFWDGKRGPIHQAWEIEAWPTVYLIDHEGIVRYRFVGIQGSLEQFEAELDAAIKELLKKVPAAAQR